MKKNNGFTLAEVLVTLAVIGIVAALTIPSLMSNTNDKQLRIAWKKAYSEIAQATQMFNVGNDLDLTSDATVRDSYETKMKFLKKDQTKNIFAPFYTYYKNIAKEGFDSSSSDKSSSILSDGSFMQFSSLSNDCTAIRGELKNVCVGLWYDINGKKSPNMIGKDAFAIWVVKKNGIYVAYPMGSYEDGTSCVIGSNNLETSNGCSAVALSADEMP